MLINEQIQKIRNFLFSDSPILLKTLSKKLQDSKLLNSLEKIRILFFELAVFCLFPIAFIFDRALIKKFKLTVLKKYDECIFLSLIISFYILLGVYSMKYGGWVFFYYLSTTVFFLLLSAFSFLLSNYCFATKNIRELESIIKTSNINDFSKNFLLENKSFFVFRRGNNPSLFQFPNLLDWSYKIHQGLNFFSLITIDIDSQKNKIQNMHRLHDEVDSFFVFKTDKHSTNYKISFLFNVTELNDIEKQKIIDLTLPLIESFFGAEYCSYQNNIIFNNEIDSIFRSHYQQFLLNKKLNLIENNPIKKQVFKKQKI